MNYTVTLANQSRLSANWPEHPHGHLRGITMRPSLSRRDLAPPISNFTSGRILSHLYITPRTSCYKLSGVWRYSKNTNSRRFEYKNDSSLGVTSSQAVTGGCPIGRWTTPKWRAHRHRHRSRVGELCRFECRWTYPTICSPVFGYQSLTRSVISSRCSRGMLSPVCDRYP